MPARRRLLACCWAGMVLGAPYAAPQAAPQAATRAAPLVAAQASTQPVPAVLPIPSVADQVYPGLQDLPLGRQIADLVQSSTASSAHWGIAVTTMDGTPVLGWHERQLFRPASTAKLFTTAAALALLGPGHTVTTTVQGSFDPATGTVGGDLRLVGSGDPSLGTADLPFMEHPLAATAPDALRQIADRLVALGVRRVTGDLLGDDTLFAQEEPPEGWAAEDLLWGYGALPSALSLDDNQLRLRISAPPLAPGSDTLAPTAETSADLIHLEQRVPWIEVHQDLRVMPAGSGAAPHLAVASVSRSPAAAAAGSEMGSLPQAIRVFGSLRPGAPVNEELAIVDPAAYAAAALRQLLVDRGVEIAGGARAVHTPDTDARPYLQRWREPEAAAATQTTNASAGCPAGAPSSLSPTPEAGTLGPPTPGEPSQRLLSYPSAPLREEVVYTLKTSANLHAELLLRQLALPRACAGITGVQGAAVVRRWLLSLGLPEHDFVFYDGSGLSTKDLVTPRMEAALLAYAAKQSWFGDWETALPLGGIDGTLANRFTSAALRGQVQAKTGTLGESRALAGYIRCRSGRQLIFSILVDDHEPGSTAERSTMDAIVAAIAAAE